MIGFEKDLIEETLAKQIEQIKSCRISSDKGRENIKISEKNSELILRFLEECLARGLSKNRVMFYLCRLRKLLQMVRKNFDEMNKDDVKNLVKEIEFSNYKQWTKQCYKITIKKFFQFIRGYEWDSKQYPPEVSWIKISSKNNNRLPEEILSFEEVQKMVENASNLRDKALIYVLYESGARISEIIGLKIKHVSFDKDGAVIIVNGKTGSITNAQNALTSAQSSIAAAQNAISQAAAQNKDVSSAQDYLNSAQSSFNSAQDYLSRANSAFASEDYASARSYADQATTYANSAKDKADQAYTAAINAPAKTTTTAIAPLLPGGGAAILQTQPSTSWILIAVVLTIIVIGVWYFKKLKK